MKDGLASGRQVLGSSMSTRRVEQCWEATRAPRWTRIPQAWAASVAQAGLLRDRPQSEKSQGFGDRVPESSPPDQTETKNGGKSALASPTTRRFTLNQYRFPSPPDELLHFSGGHWELARRRLQKRPRILADIQDSDNLYAVRENPVTKEGFLDHNAAQVRENG